MVPNSKDLQSNYVKRAEIACEYMIRSATVMPQWELIGELRAQGFTDAELRLAFRMYLQKT